MPGSSTTARPIPDLKTPNCWARHQLHHGIKEALRWKFTMELYSPGRGGGGVKGGVSNRLYIGRTKDYE